MRKFLLVASMALPWVPLPLVGGPLVGGPALAQSEVQRAQATQGQAGQGQMPQGQMPQGQPTQGQGLQGRAGTGLQAPTPSGSQRGTSRAETMPAASFARLVSISDLYELEAARVATERSQNQAVRDFAQRMVQDHTATTQQLQAAMQGMAPTPPTAALDARHNLMLNQLRNARASDFDRLYIGQQVAAHQDAVDLFRNYGQAGDNQNLRQWASATLPRLEQHLQAVRQLQQQGRS